MPYEPLTHAKTSGEFSVYWRDPAGTNHCEVANCGPEEAVQTAISLTRRPAVALGIIRKVWIVDGGDMTNWDWEDGKVIFDGKEKSQ